MTHAALAFTDYTLFVLHAALIIFSVIGWAFARTRVLHLIAFVLTSLSWFVVGPLYYSKLGWCVCTEVHLSVRQALEYPSEINYVDMLVNRISGGTINLGTTWSEASAGIVYAFVLIATIVTWTRVGLKRRAARLAAQTPLTEPQVPTPVTSSPAVRSPESTSP